MPDQSSNRANQRVASPVFQVAIVDVDSGLVITTLRSGLLMLKYVRLARSVWNASGTAGVGR